MKKNQTRRALFMSALSLLLCMSMLVGTTFAWFTDSVTSANNIIKSGNLDIELEYAVFNEDGTFKEWVDVAGKSDILTNTLWEPGVTEIAYLRVANAGSLALKYQMGINIVSETLGKTKDNADIKLSDHILFGVVEGINGATNAYANREAAVADLTDAKKLNAGYTKASSMTKDQELYLALVVYMPTTVGNEANHNGTDVPQIDLGINVFATQLEAEEDSFGKDYDKDAEYDSNAVVNGNATESTKLSTENTRVEIPAGAEGGTYVLDTSEITTTEKDGVVTATMDITLLRNGEKATTTAEPFKVIVNIGAGLNLTKVLHNDVELTGYTYDIATGDLTFETTHFSPFAFVYDNGADVATLDELLAALATDTRVINLKNDIEASEVVLIGRSVMINGNGYKVTSNATRVFRVTTNDVDVILNDVNMVSTAVRVDSNDVRGISIDIVENVKLTLNNCTVDFTDASANDWAYAVNVTGGANHTVTVNGGAYEGANLINVRSAKSAVTVKNATLTSTYPNTEAYIDLNYFGACIYVLKNQGTSVYASGNTYIGDNAVAYNLGVGNFLEEGDNVDNATTLATEARIGGAIYDTLAKAVAAANAGDKVVLIRDIVLDETVVIPEDKTITLNLNGKKVTAPAVEFPDAICAIQNKGTLTVTGNGTIEGSYTALYSNGNLTIENGTFTASAGFGVLIDNIYGTEDSVAVINGGTFTGVGIYNPTDVTIKGGTFNVGRDPDGASDHLSDKMTLFISPTFDTGAPNTANVTLNGGTFNGDVYVYDDGITETVFVNNGATITGVILDNA